MAILIGFQSCSDSRLYPNSDSDKAYLRDVERAFISVSAGIRAYKREVEKLPDSVETLDLRGYVELEPEMRIGWAWKLEVNNNGHLSIEAVSNTLAPVGKDLKLIYDYTTEKWKRPYKFNK